MFFINNFGHCTEECRHICLYETELYATVKVNRVIYFVLFRSTFAVLSTLDTQIELFYLHLYSSLLVEHYSNFAYRHGQDFIRVFNKEHTYSIRIIILKEVDRENRIIYEENQMESTFLPQPAVGRKYEGKLWI